MWRKKKIFASDLKVVNEGRRLFMRKKYEKYFTIFKSFVLQINMKCASLLKTKTLCSRIWESHSMQLMQTTFKNCHSQVASYVLSIFSYACISLNCLFHFDEKAQHKTLSLQRWEIKSRQTRENRQKWWNENANESSKFFAEGKTFFFVKELLRCLNTTGNSRQGDTQQFFFFGFKLFWNYVWSNLIIYWFFWDFSRLYT